MSKISYPQLVKDIADAYRSVTKTTEPIIVGELVAKLTEAMSDSGTNIDYKSIEYNEDNTIALIDNNDVEHIMVCNYEDGKITSITFDNEEVKLSYDGDDLIAVENTMMNLNNVPKTSRLTTKGGCNVNVVYPIVSEQIKTIALNGNVSGITTVILESEE